jgi:hypothetical protein
MGAFNDMYNHFEKNMGNIGATRGIFREPDSKTLDHLLKDDLEEAEKTKADQPTVEEILQAIKERKGEEHTQKAVNLEKVTAEAPKGRGDYPSADKIYAQAYNILQAIFPEIAGDFQGDPDASQKRWGTKPNQLLERIHDDLAAGELSPQEIYTKYGGEGEYSGGGGEVENSMGLHKMGPALANLLSAAAGWALSADTASRDVPPEMASEWERAISREDKRRLQEEMLRRMHGKGHKRTRKSDDDLFLDSLVEMEMLYKDHAPVPPRYGLMWDAVKHRWTRPEKVGRTVWEVQGKKRLRGAGTGAHERTRSTKGAGGKGAGSMEAGRRFRSVADAGRAEPHEAKRVGQVKRHIRKPVGRK